MYENIYVYIEVSAFVLIHSCILSFSPALFYCVLFVRVHSGHSSSFFFFFFNIPLSCQGRQPYWLYPILTPRSLSQMVGFDNSMRDFGVS